MKLPFLPTRENSAANNYPAVPTAIFAAITALFFVAAISDARAQFTFASDNAADSVYSSGSGGWEQGDNGGFGFGGWGFSGGGVNAGSFIGNPNNNGIANTNMGSTAFGMFSSANNSGFANRSRGFDVGMGIGDSFTFDWGINWDAGSGAKGFDLRSGSTNIFTIINGGSPAITFSNRLDSSSGTASSTYGTNNMAVTLTRTATGYTFTMTSRNTGGLFTTNITTTATIDNFNFFIGNQSDDNGNRNMYFDNLSITNSGVFSQGGSVTNANRFTGSGNLSVGNSTTLALSGTGNNNYAGTTTISNNSTLRFQGAGASDFVSAISGGGSLVMSNTGGVLNLGGNNSGFIGSINVAAGIVEARNANALGTTAGTTTVASGATLKIFTNSTGFTLAENITISGVGAGSGIGAINNTGGDNTLSGTITLSGNSRINADTTGGSGSLTISGNIGGGNNVLFVGTLGATSPTTGGNVTISGVVSGAGGTQDGTTSVFKDGIGALTLSGVNTYTGATLLNAGTILIGNNAAFGSGVVQAHFGDFSAAKVLASTDGTARTMANALNIFGSNLTLGATDRTGGLTFNGNVSLGNDITGDNQRTVTTAAGTSHTFGGIVSGNTSNLLIKSGTGTLTLNGNNTFNAGLQLNDGAILVGNNNALGTGTFQVQFDVGGTRTLASASSDSYTLANNINIFNTLTLGQTEGGTGSLTLSGSVALGDPVGETTSRVLTVNGNHTIAGQISGGNALAKAGNGTLTLTSTNNSGDNRYNLLGGELQVSAVGNLGDRTGSFLANKLFFNGGTLGVTGNIDLDGENGVTLGGNGTIRVTTGNTLTLQGYINDGELSGLTLSKTGAGTLFFSKEGVNDFSGTTLVINEGTVSTWNPGLMPAAIQLGSATAATSGTYRFDKSGGAVTAANNFAVNSGGGAITVAADPLTLSGAISGSGALSKTGTGSLSLTGNSGYSGALTVSAGTLQLNRTGGAALASVASADVATGAVLLISQSNQVNNSAAVTLSGGTIARATGVSEVFGNLNITSASFLNFGSGTAGDFQFQTYANTGSALVTVQNFFEGNRLQFLSTSFNADNLSAFTFDNAYTTSIQGDYFTITAIPEPSTYLAAAGLLAVFLWPVRRRLIKDAKSILGLRPTGRDRIEAYRNA